MNCIFLFDAADLHSERPGGVQLCTRQFLEIITEACGGLRTIAVQRATNFGARIRRRVFGSYRLYNERANRELVSALRADCFSHVFLNRNELIRFAKTIKETSPKAKVVLMSHGTQSGDDLYELCGRFGRNSHISTRLCSSLKLALDLQVESSYRHRFVDAVCVMSEQEAVLERWLGTRVTVILPRVIHPAPLHYVPIPRRCGFVGTLDHTPNRAALEQLFGHLVRASAPEINIRLVGGPQEAGTYFSSRFPFVTYLGPLDDALLRCEAATWSAFINPIFWLARGASMKLGTALAWGIPILTTRSGARGYEWRDGHLTITDDNAADFARHLYALLEDSRTSSNREGVLKVAASSPTASDLAGRLLVALSSVDDLSAAD